MLSSEVQRFTYRYRVHGQTSKNSAENNTVVATSNSNKNYLQSHVNKISNKYGHVTLC